MGISDKSVLIIGGAGFIGSHVVDELVDRNPQSLTVLDNFSTGRKSNIEQARDGCSQLVIYNANAADNPVISRVVAEQGVDIVFNLGVVPLPASLDQPKTTYQVNVDIAMNCCELARQRDIRLVHVSSSEVYGDCQTVPMDEFHPIDPKTPYAASKAAGDDLVESYRETFGIESVIVRPFNNYGPRQNAGKYAGIVPKTIRRILKGDSPIIFGDGDQTRDFIYVDDTVKAIINTAMCDDAIGEIINICYGNEVSVETIIKTIMYETEFDGSVEYRAERTADITRHVGDNTKATEFDILCSPTPFETGIAETVEWYGSHLENVLDEPVEITSENLPDQSTTASVN